MAHDTEPATMADEFVDEEPASGAELVRVPKACQLLPVSDALNRRAELMIRLGWPEDYALDASLSVLIRSLASGKLRAYARPRLHEFADKSDVIGHVRRVPLEYWAPKQHGEWPIARLMSSAADFPFGMDGPPASLVDNQIFGSEIALIDWDIADWLRNDGVPRRPSSPPAALEEVINFLQGCETAAMTQDEIFRLASAHFGDRRVKPYHASQARKAVEGGRKRRPGRASKQNAKAAMTLSFSKRPRT